MKSGLYAAQNISSANLFAKTTLITTGTITGATLGVLVLLLGRSRGLWGPFANINFSVGEEPIINNTALKAEVLSNINKTTSVITENLNSSKDININSPLEYFYSNIDPLSDVPLIGIISLSIIFIIVGIQCLKFIFIRWIFINYFSKIETYLINFPRINKIFLFFINI